MLKATLCPLIEPRSARGERDQHDDGHEVPRDHVGKLSDRRLASLRLLDELDDLRQSGVASDAGGAEGDRAVLVDTRPGDLVPGLFSTGMLSPVSMDSSTEV